MKLVGGDVVLNVAGNYTEACRKLIKRIKYDSGCSLLSYALVSILLNGKSGKVSSAEGRLNFSLGSCVDLM